MRRSELSVSRTSHGIAGLKVQGLLEELKDCAIPGEHVDDWQTEVLDQLQAVVTYCEEMAQHCDNQAQIQSYDGDLEREDQRERMG